MKIEIPFSVEFATRMATDRKTATTRYKRYGLPADYFEYMGHLYCLDEVKRVYLYRVAQHCYRQEGFDTEQEFINCWTRLHPQRGYRPNDEVYYHRFFRET